MEKSWLDNLKIILVLPTSFSTSLAAKNEGRIKFNQSIKSVVTQLPLSTELSGQKGFTASFSFKQIGRTNAENFGNFWSSFKRAMSGLHINFWKYFLLPEFDSQPTHGPSRGVATPAILCYKYKEPSRSSKAPENNLLAAPLIGPFRARKAPIRGWCSNSSTVLDTELEKHGNDQRRHY